MSENRFPYTQPMQEASTNPDARIQEGSVRMESVTERSYENVTGGYGNENIDEMGRAR